MRNKYLYIIAFFSILLLSLHSCRNKHTETRTVSVSILPQKYFIEKIAGDYVKVNVMVPPGMSPATCDLSTEQLKKLYDSDLCFTVGYLPFELTHLYPVLTSRSDIRLINHSEGIDLIDGSCGHLHAHAAEDRSGGHEGVDPHIWLSPRYARDMASTVLKVLSEQYPEQQEQFARNYQGLLAEIDAVATQADSVLSGKQHKSFLIYHPALTYFAKDYGMEQISIEDEGKEPNPAHLKKIIDSAKEKDIRIIFIQSQFDVNNAKSIAKEIGATVIPIDPLNENWTAEMNRLIEIFNDNLN
ncbi:MAG: ABC transporter substrate-binding protein [Odoribacter splanchnicus]|nr:ABC transporter substrate-binding protein [Odoribacter splanchnicus]